MNDKILVIHPGYGKTGTTSFQHLLKSLNVNILARPTENQSKTISFKLFIVTKFPFIRDPNI